MESTQNISTAKKLSLYTTDKYGKNQEKEMSKVVMTWTTRANLVLVVYVIAYSLCDSSCENMHGIPGITVLWGSDHHKWDFNDLAALVNCGL